MILIFLILIGFIIYLACSIKQVKDDTLNKLMDDEDDDDEN